MIVFESAAYQRRMTRPTCECCVNWVGFHDALVVSRSVQMIGIERGASDHDTGDLERD